MNRIVAALEAYDVLRKNLPRHLSPEKAKSWVAEAIANNGLFTWIRADRVIGVACGWPVESPKARERYCPTGSYLYCPLVCIQRRYRGRRGQEFMAEMLANALEMWPNVRTLIYERTKNGKVTCREKIIRS